eukprot:COSAG02_NODE_4937_length_4812_cov_8.775302_4_plen_70_part_00
MCARAAARRVKRGNGAGSKTGPGFCNGARGAKFIQGKRSTVAAVWVPLHPLLSADFVNLTLFSSSPRSA